MKGILLGGGKATRMYPITKVMTKHLLPVYDKPMIFYSLSLLMYADVREILVITDRMNLKNYREILGNGTSFGLNLSYRIQKQPNGIAQAILLGEKFIGKDHVCLVLGDTILYSDTLEKDILTAKNQLEHCSVLACLHEHPEHFGVISFSETGEVINIEEKPIAPSSNYVIPGFYLYDNSCIEKVKRMSPSERGELEITDLNNQYFREGNLKVSRLKDLQYMDAGRYDSLLDASNFIRNKQDAKMIPIGDIKKIARDKGWI